MQERSPFFSVWQTCLSITRAAEIVSLGDCTAGDCNPSLYKAYSHSKEPTSTCRGQVASQLHLQHFSQAQKPDRAWAGCLLLPPAAVALSPWTHNELSPSTFLYGLCLWIETAVLEEMSLILFASPAHGWLGCLPAGCGSH